MISRPQRLVHTISLWDRADEPGSVRLTPGEIRQQNSRDRQEGGEGAMADIRIMATDLDFPEGPVAVADGAVILGEIKGRRVTRIAPDGGKIPVGSAGGGPNGLARGPDGALYLCNNGGNEYAEGGFLSTGPAKGYQSGCIQRIDPRSGEKRILYSQCNGHK